ncbi:MAG: Stringent starvation protein B [Candidatus Tokpelaia sp. JSC188]|nr:MAG: Stringent starvation protein B [Candidatus Tokpelaia sp. JSC188]
MTHNQICYKHLIQDALRDVIRKILADVVRKGLSGDHHFFISFLTNMREVKISSKLKKRYPQQMTIVLQHQFWDLQVEHDYFQVKLSFDGIPEKLIIPFSSILAFCDPTAAFKATFEIPKITEHTDLNNSEKIVDIKKKIADVISLDACRKNK